MKTIGGNNKPTPQKVFVDCNNILCPHFDSELSTFGGFLEGGVEIVAVTVFDQLHRDEFQRIINEGDNLLQKAPGLGRKGFALSHHQSNKVVLLVRIAAFE